MLRGLILTCGSVAAGVVVACATAPGAGHVGGGELYRSRCASCHRLYAPGERTRGEWTGVLDRMAPRAHLSGGERDAIGRYLSANAKDAEASR